MEDTLISFQVAKLAKEKGFKLGSGWQIRSLFNIKDGKTFCEKTIETPEHACERCSQSLLQKWLREVYNIHIAVLPKILPSNEIKYYCFKGKIKKDFKGLYNTYEEALEKGLQEALKLI